MSSNELYDLYKDAGQVPTEILTNGILAVTCFSGITLNMLLVYVTFKSKSLHSTCNILIAFYAFSISFLLIGDSTSLFFNFIMPLLGLNFLTIEYIVWPICNGLASMACSSCTPVLFLCSTDYRKAFCKYLCRTEHHVTVVVPLRIMPASNIRA
ncbi:hypothetical protein niasHT_012134 [Heterodera trifolii]|uniref:G-protein coupled receptors family 1 profile domain-containing protein n=1 Tax=Heterodera trifolii TaxID=157864 RepID=A0ABD2LBV1_9BILA